VAQQSKKYYEQQNKKLNPKFHYKFKYQFLSMPTTNPINFLLKDTVERKASDLHIIAGYYPTLRIENKLVPLKTIDVITAQSAQDLLFSLLSKEQKELMITNKELDFGFTFGEHRFRVNYYYEKGSLAASFRIIPTNIKSIEELNLPAKIHEFSQFRDGLILVTGPTGEGKSTTLASLINEINMNDSRHIITIEDPIEYVYPIGKSIISQRELLNDTHSWSKALKAILREDPDVVLIGEMRDFDTIQAALTIAETGHLVFSTLHTSTTPEAINRIIDIFPPNQQPQIRHQLSSVLKAVVTQRLLPTLDRIGRVPAVEILLNMPSVATMIREGKTYMLDNVIETNEEQGMILFEKYLLKLYKQDLISKDTALAYAERVNEVKKFIT
jgi:twitching motility protein PilT